jgi:hypothetical protein
MRSAGSGMRVGHRESGLSVRHVYAYSVCPVFGCTVYL